MSGSISRIALPAHEYRVQSPYLYLQSVGSTGADGSSYGAHVRWLFAGNLGDTHMPKGGHSHTNVGFNRPRDYVSLYRARYLESVPTIVDLSRRPDVVHDSLALWVYLVPGHGGATPTVVYLRFPDAARYAVLRATIDPLAAPLELVRNYCPARLEVESPDKLFFAAELDVVRDATTVLRAEALSVEANVPLSPLFVSCRARFTATNWCDVARGTPPDGGKSGPSEPSIEAWIPGQPPPCTGPNLLLNGGFERLPQTAAFAFETDYVLGGGAGPGILNVVGDARTINPRWVGGPRSGESFLAVDGATTAADVVRFRSQVQPCTRYRLSGWLSTLYAEDPAVPLEVRFTGTCGVEAFPVRTPAGVGRWERFTLLWDSGDAESVTVSIASLSRVSVGNDFGIDDLTFCEANPRFEEGCRARLASENVRAVRFDVTNGYPTHLFVETYDDFLLSVPWLLLDDSLALTLEDDTVLSRLEPAAGPVHGRWPKFNDGAAVNVGNYRDRWLRQGGLKEGVDRYLTLSETDPLATATLLGANPEDGAIEVSLLAALQIVSLDFHVARMLGLGRLDLDVGGDDDDEAYVYLAVYDTEGALDDGGGARTVRHYAMGVPTALRDARPPQAPTLQPVTYGLTVDDGQAQSPSLTDAAGYTPDGQSRYVNLFLQSEPAEPPLGPFFVPPDEFCALDHTPSIFYGIEYRGQGETSWRHPEIAHDLEFLGADGAPETLALPNNANPSKPLLRHEEREDGVHEYGGYGINLFSRVSAVGNVVATDATTIKKAPRLLPPANFQVQLVQPESPPLLTTAAEQAMLAALSGDTTLVRVTFDYYHVHDVNYAFADQVELFFRTAVPRNVVGALAAVTDDSGDPRRAVLRTKPYPLLSQGTTISPQLDAASFPNFVGGVLSCQQETYTIAAVEASTVSGEGVVLSVHKNVRTHAVDPTGAGAYVTVQELVAPVLDANAPVLFMAVENMAAAASWGAPNPLATRVALPPSLGTHQETYVQDGLTVTQTLRGVYAPATVTDQGDGLYRIEVAAILPHHPQHGDADPVQWHQGSVRIPRAADPVGPRKVLDVAIVEHLGDGQPLVLHAVDEEPSDPVQTGGGVMVNYYPGYRLYLHAAPAHHLDAATIQPSTGEGTRRTWLGARAIDSAEPYFSAVGIPAPLIAVELVTPEVPGKPQGAEFATWPDFHFKSSYTFTVDFHHQPFAVAMYRTNEEAILRALYKEKTYQGVRQELELLGEDDPYRGERWRDLMGLQYAGGTFASFPPQNGYAFPHPDRGDGLDGSPPGDVLPALRQALWGAFTALTEQPLIYDFIKPPTYAPVSRPPRLRNAQGVLLAPTDPEFDPSPMAKRTGHGTQGREIQFTDFTLDGAGSDLFFYFAREIGNRGRLGEPSPIAGPVRLINTRPPEAPAVKAAYVRVASDASGAAVRFEVDPHPAAQRVRRLLVYRASEPDLALSVRTMALVKTVDLEASGQLGAPVIEFTDDFAGEALVPYGDPLFYRLVAQRKIATPAGDSWAPSHPSKVLLTTVVDTVNPEAPEITFTATGPSGSPPVLADVVLSWTPTVHNGSYSLQVMSADGTWRTIHTVEQNDAVNVSLAATALETDVLPKGDEPGRTLYHRFRVRVVGSSGLLNLSDRVLTI